MPVTQRDITNGRVDVSRLAERHGGWLGAQGPDPRDQPDFDLDPPVERDTDGVVQGATRVRTGAGE